AAQAREGKNPCLRCRLQNIPSISLIVGANPKAHVGHQKVAAGPRATRKVYRGSTGFRSSSGNPMVTEPLANTINAIGTESPTQCRKLSPGPFRFIRRRALRRMRG